MKLMDPGTVVDGFVIGDCLHAGGMAHIYAVTFEGGTTSPFPMVMKVPRMTAGDGSENIVGFEVAYRRYQPRFIYLERREGAQIMLCERRGKWETGPTEPSCGRGDGRSTRV